MSKNSESFHWYTQEGAEMHQVENKSKPGEMRNTTIRDAKSLSLLPSVTTVMKVLDRPGLNVWKEQQILEACLTLPRIEGEELHDFAKRVREDAKAHGKEAAEEGTKIHGILEMNSQDPKAFADNIYVVSVKKALLDHFGDQDWEAERSFACPEGYAGKVDLYSPEIVIDYKTKGLTDKKFEKVKGYDEQSMQLAAYRKGLGLEGARCANVFISTTTPGLVKIHEWTEEELERGWNMFYHALKFWNVQKKYETYFDIPFP